ncbi:MAG: Preprotein translocase subunit YidC [uncultured bacterium]|nr:MAG: Preprotein translocase subunit YidC [uncultured bacterium]
MTIYNDVLYKPLFNAMVFLYDIIPDKTIAVGLAIIFMTLIIKFALFSMSNKSILAQRDMQKLQPKMNAIKAKYKNDKERQSRELMKFYKENKINPFSSCLPLLIQLPILIALYGVFRDGLSNAAELGNLYSFVPNPGRIEANFLGFLDLSVPNIWLAILAGALQFIQSWMLLKVKTKQELKNEEERKKQMKKKKQQDPMDAASNMTKQMTYFMPIITVFIAVSLPSGLAFYWVVTTLFAIAQQWYIMKKKERLEFKDIQSGSKKKRN